MDTGTFARITRLRRMLGCMISSMTSSGAPGAQANPPDYRQGTTLPYGTGTHAEWVRITYLTAVVVLVFSLFMLLRLVEMLQQLPSLTLYYGGNVSMWNSLIA